MTDEQALPKLNGAILRNRSHSADHAIVRAGMMLWRRRWLPVGGLGIGLALGVLVLLVTPPLYRAGTQIMIDGNTDALKSEVEIIESTPVLGKVAGMLGLYQDHEFTHPNALERLYNPGARSENAVRDRVQGRLEDMIHVGIIPGTGIIDMSVRNRDPDRAAQVANALLSSYQERKVDERFEQSRQIASWMSKRLEDIKAQAEDAKAKLNAFQAQHGLAALSNADMKAERLEMLNRAMGQAQEEIASLSNRLDQTKKPSGTQSAQGVLQSDRINSLKKTETHLAVDLAQMQLRYGDKHPKIIAQRAELARVRQDLARETTNTVNAIGQDLNIARGRIDSLQVQIDALSVNTDVDGRIKLELKNLESDVAATDRLYTDFLVKYQDVLAQTELRVTDLKVISMATIPSRPDTTARSMFVLKMGLLGFIIGFLAAALRIALNTGFTSSMQLEAMSGYPVFAAVPLASVIDQSVHHNVTQDPAAILAELLRSLRVSLRLRGEAGRRPRVIALTSTVPDEGKTSMAVMLAMVAAKSGERVCVVDCDLRKPSVHKAFGIGNARGLADYLSDRLGIDDIIHSKDPSGVHLVTARAVPSHSLTLLTSGRMERLIDNLREQYDLVILDAPSSLAFADARVLARMVDQTLYVVAWNRTRRESVLTALKFYADMGYSDLALVLNKVDLGEYLRDFAAAIVYQYGREQSLAASA